jgi:hypothetical protein
MKFKGIIKWAVYGIGILCALALVAIGAFVLMMFMSFGTPSKIIVDKPQTYNQARKRCPISLPPTASDIQYAMYGDWQIADHYVKFRAPVEDCIDNARVVIAKNKKDHPQRRSDFDHTFEFVRKPASPDSTFLGKLPWFDIGNITNGISLGGDGDMQPHIWIDKDRGIFYYHLWH